MQVEQPLFTIATITYNSGKWVRQAIESILSSSFKNFELVISDDCSTDETWEIIQEYNDNRIRAWRNQQNIGEYPNRNKVLNEARGKFILFIDGDDILYKDALARCFTYLSAFPEAKAVWGVYPLYFDFVALPYLFTPLTLTRLNYLSTYPITVVGFAESFFSVEVLLQIGGFDERFAIGDTYIKRKFCCLFPVLLVTAGFAYWRQYPEQASNRVRSFYKNLTETYQIDKDILWSNVNPLSEEELRKARINFQIRTIKIVVVNTIRKGKFLDFFKLMNQLQLPYTQIRYLMNKGDYSYKAGAEVGYPLLNDFHFKR
jgi:glycosyltransferase involved in cell wall biosynthesis